MPSIEQMRDYLLSIGMNARYLPTDVHTLAVMFFQKKRQIDWLNHPRNTHLSDCFTESMRDKWEHVRLLLETGASEIYRYLSSGVRRGRQDMMLNYDNIYHFHSIPMGEDRQNERLFVHITEDSAYLLGEYPHHEEAKMPLRLLQLLYRNWPDLFECREGISNLTEQQIINIRSKNGNVYEFPLAPNIIGRLKDRGGVAPSGQSMLDLIRADIICDNM
ncbi:hypothetical protein HDR61_05205 [bacterium]|nr:hypothetical protein [bacterium]